MIAVDEDKARRFNSSLLEIKREIAHVRQVSKVVTFIKSKCSTVEVGSRTEAEFLAND